MNKTIMRAAGLGKAVERVERGDCIWCGKAVHPNAEFKDELSQREFNISGMCQACQDGVFGS